jgi:hypothetical protein
MVSLRHTAAPSVKGPMHPLVSPWRAQSIEGFTRVFQVVSARRWRRQKRRLLKEIRAARQGDGCCALKLDASYAQRIAHRGLWPTSEPAVVVCYVLPSALLAPYQPSTFAYTEQREYLIPLEDSHVLRAPSIRCDGVVVGPWAARSSAVLPAKPLLGLVDNERVLSLLPSS